MQDKLIEKLEMTEPALHLRNNTKERTAQVPKSLFNIIHLLTLDKS